MAGMTKMESQPLVNIGDFVKILHISDLHGRVVEFRGPAGTGWHARIPRRGTKEAKALLCRGAADQLEVVSTKG